MYMYQSRNRGNAHARARISLLNVSLGEWIGRFFAWRHLNGKLVERAQQTLQLVIMQSPDEER